MKKHSLKILGHVTSVSLEEPFWEALKAFAKEEKISLNALAAKVDAARGKDNLSSALRLYVLYRLQQKAG